MLGSSEDDGYPAWATWPGRTALILCLYQIGVPCQSTGRPESSTSRCAERGLLALDLHTRIAGYWCLVKNCRRSILLPPHETNRRRHQHIVSSVLQATREIVCLTSMIIILRVNEPSQTQHHSNITTDVTQVLAPPCRKLVCLQHAVLDLILPLLPQRLTGAGAHSLVVIPHPSTPCNHTNNGVLIVL